MAKYFLDTYAIIEIVKGNEDYVKFLNSEFYTNLLNLYELYYNLIRDFDEETAKKYFYQFRNIVVDIEDGYVFGASLFKLEHKKAKVSYADALGYVMALENGMKFLTGDKEFRDFENVEFV
jgi:uncharacterized protein